MCFQEESCGLVVILRRKVIFSPPHVVTDQHRLFNFLDSRALFNVLIKYMGAFKKMLSDYKWRVLLQLRIRTENIFFESINKFVKIFSCERGGDFASYARCNNSCRLVLLYLTLKFRNKISIIPFKFFIKKGASWSLQVRFLAKIS